MKRCNLQSSSDGHVSRWLFC